MDRLANMVVLAVAVIVIFMAYSMWGAVFNHFHDKAHKETPTEVRQ